MKPTFKKPHKETCSRGECENELKSQREKKQRYCRTCHAEYMREWRKRNSFTLIDMKRCFEQSRLTNPMIGFKHDTFEDYIKSIASE